MPVGTPTQSKPLAPAPVVAHDVVPESLLNGELCDCDGPYAFEPFRGCPQRAYVQVRFIDENKITAGDLFYCYHHFNLHQVVIELMVSLGSAGIIVDERERVFDGMERKDISA